jgi:hypothetical protein
MARIVTLRLSDNAYHMVKHYAEAEHESMNSWVERVLDAEDMRRRCAAHGAWMEAHPEVAANALAFHAANQRAVARAGRPAVAPDIE